MAIDLAAGFARGRIELPDLATLSTSRRGAGGGRATDTTLIAPVHQLISTLLVAKISGAALKGIERPVQLYRVIQPSEVSRRSRV